MKENQLARDIVANLGYRWLQSRRVLRHALHSGVYQDLYLDMCYNIETADWNAFEVSRRILYGKEISNNIR